MFLDPVVRTAASRRARMFAAVAIAAAVVVSSVPAESATRKKQAAAPAAATPKVTRSAATTPFSRPSSVALVDDVTNGATILRQGTVASLASSTVIVGGTRTVTIDALANESLAEARTVQNQVVSARAGLFADPAFTEEVRETADATILTSRSVFTVIDRTAVSAKVPSLGAFRPKSVSLNSLSRSQRDAFDQYKRSLDAKPAGHPLKEAAARGDAALLDALKQGQADVTMTTTVRVEKAAAPLNGKYAKLATPPVVVGAAAGASSAVDLNGAQGTPTGEANHTAKFLTGWSKGDALHWSERIDIGFAWAEIGAHAGYVVGLRVPVEMKGTMTPGSIARNGSGNFNDSYEVKVYDVAAVDGDEKHYRGTGLDEDLVGQGKEFALQADLYVFAKGEVLGLKFNERFPKKPVLDEGQNFRPPYGDCGVECGLNFFFPASLTKTGFDIAGVLAGGGQLGFNVGGSGVVSYDYESLVDGAVVSSTRVSSGESARTHRVSTDGRTGMTTRFKTTLPAASLSPIPFGYRLSNPGYDWNIAITPVVKASGTFDYVFGTFDFLFGPIGLPVSIELGTLKLPRHDGTQEKADKVYGKVTTDLRRNTDVVVGADASVAEREVVGSIGQPTSSVPAAGRNKRKKNTTVSAPPQASIVSAAPVATANTKNGQKKKKGGQATANSNKKKKKAAA